MLLGQLTQLHLVQSNFHNHSRVLHGPLHFFSRHLIEAYFWVACSRFFAQLNLLRIVVTSEGRLFLGWIHEKSMVESLNTLTLLNFSLLDLRIACKHLVQRYSFALETILRSGFCKEKKNRFCILFGVQKCDECLFYH